MKTSGYMKRALRSHDPRFARVLGKLGYAAPPPPVDPLDAMRAEAAGIGVLVDRRWGEARLRQEIEQARKPKAPPREPGFNPRVSEEKPKPKASEKPSADDDGRYKRRDLRAEEN